MARKRQAAGRKGSNKARKALTTVREEVPDVEVSYEEDAGAEEKNQDDGPKLEAEAEEPVLKKSKKVAERTQGLKSKPSAVEENDKAVEGKEEEPDPEMKKQKKVAGKKGKGPKSKASAAIKDASEKKEKEANEGDGVVEETNSRQSKVIIVEASKECNCFKVRAAKVHTTLTKSVPGIQVQVNPEKPRKGCFEIRDDEGTVYLSLLGLPRPFTKLKNWDLAKTLGEITAKIK